MLDKKIKKETKNIKFKFFITFFLVFLFSIFYLIYFFVSVNKNSENLSLIHITVSLVYITSFLLFYMIFIIWGYCHYIPKILKERKNKIFNSVEQSSNGDKETLENKITEYYQSKERKNSKLFFYITLSLLLLFLVTNAINWLYARTNLLTTPNLETSVNVLKVLFYISAITFPFTIINIVLLIRFYNIYSSSSIFPEEDTFNAFSHLIFLLFSFL